MNSTFDFMNPTFQGPAEKLILYVGDNTPKNGEPLMLGRIAEVVGFEGDLDEQSRRAWRLVVEPLKKNGLVEVGDPPIETKDFVDGKIRFCSSVELAGEGWKAYRKVRNPNDDLQTTDSEFRIDKALQTSRFRSALIQEQIQELLQADRMQQVIHRASQDFTSAPMRSIASVIAELKRIPSVYPPSPSIASLQQAMALEERFRASYSRPEAIMTGKLLADFQKSSFSAVMSRYSESADSLGQLMQAMTTPWLDVEKRMTSVKGLAQLRGIGTILDSLPSYSDRVTNALRIDLGDWRDQITFPRSALEKLTDRADFYERLGFDPSLTSFPAEAFEEALKKSGLRLKPPPYIERYAPLFPQSTKEQETGFERTNKAHSILLSLETRLRRFIDELMTSEFGPDWPRHNMPNGVYEQWVTKRQKAEKNDRASSSLISYADFTDYPRVMFKKDNWSKVFSKFFPRLEDIRESLQRIYLIRLDTMHARVITQDDEILLVVEAKRIFKAIKGAS